MSEANEGRRNFLKNAGLVAAGVGLAGFSGYKYAQNVENRTEQTTNQQQSPESKKFVSAGVKSENQEAQPLIEKPIEKVARGEIQITKRIPVDGRMEALKVRRDTQAAQRHQQDNSLIWDDIVSINGVDISKANTFTVLNAPLVKGNSVDFAGKESYWLQFLARLITGEQLFIYISRSSKTEAHIYDATAKDEPVYRDWAGNVIPPYNGLGIVSVPPTPLKK